MIKDLLENRKLRNKLYFQLYPISIFDGKSTKEEDYCNFCKKQSFNEYVFDLIKTVGKYQKIDTISNINLSPSCVPCDRR